MRKFLVLTSLLIAVLGFAVGGNRYLALGSSGTTQCLQFSDSALHNYWLADIAHQHTLYIPNGWPLHITSPRASSNAAYSPDGRYLAEIRAQRFSTDEITATLSVDDTQTGDLRVIMTGALIAWGWSPDSTRIAYLWFERRSGQQLAFFVGSAKPDGSEPASREFVIPPGHANLTIETLTLGSWSPDGNYLTIILGTDDKITSIGIQDAQFLQPTAFVESPVGITWAPRGHRYAYWSYSEQPENLILAAPDESSTETFSVPTNTGRRFASLKWSPDGRYLASISLRDTPLSNPGQYYYDIFDTLSREQWLDIPGELAGYDADGQNVYPADGHWSPDNRAWIFLQQRSDATDRLSDFIRADVMTKSLKTLATDVVWPDLYAPPPVAYSPDGYWIALPVWHDKKIDVLLMKSDGTEASTIATDSDQVQDLSWSSDGKFIVMRGITGNEFVPEEVRLIWARADGSDRHMVTFDDAAISQWDYMKNAFFVLVRQNQNVSLLRVDLAADTVAPLINSLDASIFEVRPSAPGLGWGISPSPDRKYIAAAYRQINYGSAAYLTSDDGSSLRVLESNVFNVGNAIWSPDGTSFVIFVDKNTMDHYFQVYSADGTLRWQIDLSGMPDIDPTTVVWTQCK